MFTDAMYQKLVEDLKEDQRIYDEDREAISSEYEVHGSDYDLNIANADDQYFADIRSDLERAERRGCNKAQAEEATKVLQYSVQNIIDDIWREDTEEEEDDSDDILNFDIRPITDITEKTEKENNMDMKKVIDKTKDTCDRMITATVNRTYSAKIGFFAEVAATLVAYFSVLCYGYKLSFEWFGKIFRKEMKISEYLKKALPASIIFSCIGWCIGKNACSLLEQYYKDQEEENNIQ